MKKKNSKDLLRSTWPKVRVVKVRGVKFYQVDARRKGTDGKQETKSTEKAALERAAQIAADFELNGKEGLALPAELRFMAVAGAEMLAPHGKTILQACQFYRDYLVDNAKRHSGATVDKLATEWHEFKKSGQRKKVRPHTLVGIRRAELELTKAFRNRPVGSITKKDISGYLDPLPIALISKRNLCSLFGQFFNWCIQEHKGITVNPAAGIKYEFETGNVTIWTIEEVRQAMSLCEKRFPEFTTFHALGLFGGLRPNEARQVAWENVNFEDKTIFISKEISKVKDDRFVPINETLLAWLELTPEEERKGLMVRKTNFTNRIRVFRAALGYRYLTEQNGEVLNADGPRGKYDNDVLRHSYGSYWLATHSNRAQLAEDMGNSVEVIRDHYKHLVPKPVAAEYWQILPNADSSEEEKKDAQKRARREQEPAFTAKDLEAAAWEIMERDAKRYRK